MTNVSLAPLDLVHRADGMPDWLAFRHRLPCGHCRIPVSRSYDLANELSGMAVFAGHSVMKTACPAQPGLLTASTAARPTVSNVVV